MLGTLIKPRNATASSKTPDTPVNAPVFSPAFMFRQPVASQIPLLPDGQHITYDRGTLVAQLPQRVEPLVNSMFQPLERGPIRNAYTRQWYWRHPEPQSDTMMPNGHVLVANGELKNLPGASSMVPHSRLTFNLRTPAWQIAPNKPAENA